MEGVSKEQVKDFIKNMTLMDAAALVKELEEELGVSASAPVAVVRTSPVPVCVRVSCAPARMGWCSNSGAIAAPSFPRCGKTCPRLLRSSANSSTRPACLPTTGRAAFACSVTPPTQSPSARPRDIDPYQGRIAAKE